MKDLVSIIMPSYNSEKYIAESIQSVIEQTYENWELLIVDDGSNDDSKQIIRKFMEHNKRIKLINLYRNYGPAIARNIGISEAKGRYIAFLDSDDIWLSYKLEKQLKFMNKNKVALCYSSYYLINEKSKITGKFIIPKKKVDYFELLKTCIIGNLTAIYDIKKVGKVFMENVGHEDYTLWLKILKKIDYAYGIKEPLSKYRIIKNSISANKLKAAKWQWNIYRNVEKLSLFESLYYFMYYAYNGLKKYR